MFLPCAALACLKLLQSVISLSDIKGKKVTVCGRSNIVGLPVALLLNRCNATVSLCHKRTPDLESYTKSADIFITAIGKPKFFKAEHIKEGAIIIDVGINEVFEEGPEGTKTRKIIGDFDYESVKDKCSKITPVPGGVGPMTIAMLMHNLIESWERMNCLN